METIDTDSASEVYLSTLSPIIKEIEEKFNNEIVKPLVAWNFPQSERVDCRLNIDDMDFKKRSEMRKLLNKMLDLSSTFIKNKGGLPFKKMPDIDKILEILDIPESDVGVFKPAIIKSERKKIGDDVFNPEMNSKNNKQSNKGPDKGERTTGNASREDRDGKTRDTDKQDEQE